MHVQFGTALVVCALVASISLMLGRGDRVVPLVAFIVAGVQALIVFGILSIAVAKFRIDVILPAVLLVTGAICWSRSSSKSATTASTVVTMVGAIQLLWALKFLR